MRIKNINIVKKIQKSSRVLFLFVAPVCVVIDITDGEFISSLGWVCATIYCYLYSKEIGK